MKQGRDLGSLAAELQRRAEARCDILADTRQIEIDPKTLFLPGSNQPAMGISELTHGQIAEYTGVPKAYYDKLRKEQPRLFSQNIETWFKAKAEQRLVRTLDGSARAFLSNRYRPIDNEDVAEAAFRALLDKPGITLVSQDVTESRLYIKALFPRTEVVKVGDEVQAGVVISNGEYGNGAMSVRVMSYRLWCLNGATHEHVVRQAHVGKALSADDSGIVYRDETIAVDDRALMMKLQDAITSVQGEPFSKLINGMKALAGAPEIAKPIAAVEVLVKKVGLTKDQGDSILTRFLKAPVQTPYELVQAVTNLANETESYDAASDLEALGGRLFDLPANDWAEISRAA